MGELKAGGFSFSWRRNVLEAATLGLPRVWAKEKQGKGFINSAREIRHKIKIQEVMWKDILVPTEVPETKVSRQNPDSGN